jgi:nucleotide-binding universal stress UspA family protein
LPIAGREAWDYLRHVAERLERRTLRVHPRLVFDEEATAGAILHYARTHDADLIALAARGSGGLARRLRDGVTDRVVRGAFVPVLVCRAATEQDGSVAR